MKLMRHCLLLFFYLCLFCFYEDFYPWEEMSKSRNAIKEFGILRTSWKLKRQCSCPWRTFARTAGENSILRDRKQCQCHRYKWRGNRKVGNMRIKMVFLSFFILLFFIFILCLFFFWFSFEGALQGWGLEMRGIGVPDVKFLKNQANKKMKDSQWESSNFTQTLRNRDFSHSLWIKIYKMESRCNAQC